MSKKKQKENQDSKRISEVNGKKTFSGVVDDYFEDICVVNHWKAVSTKERYLKEYNEIVIQCLEDINKPKTIDEYSREDYEQAIKKIRYTGKRRKVRSIEDMQHYRRLIAAVVTYAAKLNLCPNILWGTAFMVDTPNDPVSESEELTKLKKSLTPKQEINVYKLLTRNVDQPGERFGILLMFSLGLRNGEACAVCYGDIRIMHEAHDLRVLLIYKTIASKDKKLVASGKTKNADRVLPLPKKIYDFLMARKQYIAEKKGISLEEVNSYTIACHKDQFEISCKPDDLSMTGKEVFEESGVQAEILAYIDAEIVENNQMDEKADQILVREKDPTSYLLRRNFATHLHIVGCSEAEIQYLMGHDIEEKYESRNEFINLEKLENIKAKLDQRAVFLDYENYDAIRENIEFSNHEKEDIDIPENGLISLGLSEGMTQISISANEPNDKLTIRINESDDNTFEIKHIFRGHFRVDYQGERNFNVLKQYHAVYKRKFGGDINETLESENDSDEQI